jgi:hypothetical protein
MTGTPCINTSREGLHDNYSLLHEHLLQWKSRMHSCCHNDTSQTLQQVFPTKFPHKVVQSMLEARS